ncbi:PAS domain S-box protein [Alginatibacterium sediminis]|uniref:histidine kinase n=1 Tax=Alginatibacterium sediminis TaxID=2164068 RepID=A0A420EDG5_9ALTE|nr:PAS domain S-box protein [Alginatibacterium sediminis]RKF18779.1 PAS domain S-box protein [Alginatibacterium sediminis]
MRLKLSFRAKTVLGVTFIQAALLAVLVVASVRWLHDSNEQHLIHYTLTTTELIANTSARALAQNDIALLDSTVQELLTKPYISYVIFENSSGEILSQGGRDYPTIAPQSYVLKPSDTLDGVFRSYANIAEQGQVIGRVLVGIHVNQFHELIGTASSFAMGLAALNVAMLGVFSLLLGTYLTRRLLRLRDAAKTITEVGPGLQLDIDGDDEISQAMAAFNKMSKALEKSHLEFKQSISQQERLSTELSRHQQLLKASLSSSMDAVITIDRHGHIIEFSQSAERIFGYTREHMMGKDLSDYIVPEHLREAHRKGLKHFRDTGEAPVLGQRLELPAIDSSGREFLSELTISSVEVGDDTIFTAYMRDISDRKLAEQELRLAAQAFDANEAIFITDAKATIVRVNQAFCRITGYSEVESIGSSPSLLSSQRHDQAFFKNMWQALNDTGSWQGEIVNQRKNGELLPEWLSISSVKDSNEVVTHYVAHFTDLSEQKAVEASLSQAKVDAEAASLAKSRFLASMSHEIRTPLNAIINMNQILKESQLDDQQRHFVNTANEAGHTLMALVNNVLDFSRIEAGRLEFNEEWFNPRSTLRSIVELFDSTASQKYLSLSLDLDENLSDEYFGEPLRFRQIVFNLLGNALKFTNHGGVKVSLLVEAEQGVLLKIQDTGIGISAEQQAHLFEEFFQVDNTSTRTYSGTGLGLAITHQIVEKMNGKITIDSVLDQGTCFSVLLPFSGRKSPLLPMSSSKKDGPSLARKPIVLLVEDSAMNRSVVEQVLKGYVHELVCANDGRQGLQQAQQRKFDIILMDMAMPVMDGLEATRRIREKLGPNQHCPIIAMTANAFEEDKQACFSAGMNDFITKPLDIALLRSCIEQWSMLVSGDLLDLDSELEAEANISHEPHQQLTTEQLDLSQIEAAELRPDFKDEKATEAIEDEFDDPRFDKFDILDVKRLEQLAFDAGFEALPLMLNLLESETNERLDELMLAFEQQDWSSVCAQAHAIKGNVATFGAKRLQMICAQVESSAKSEDSSELEKLVPYLPKQVEIALAAILDFAQAFIE